MHHAILQLGGVTIYAYSLLMALAVLIGVSVAVWDGRRRSLEYADVLDAAILTLLAGLLGARLEYVLLNLGYFAEQPVAALRVWDGGLALQGGLWLGIAALVVHAGLRRRPFWPLVDALALGLSAATVLGWLACLYGGCAYGRTGFGTLHFTWHDAFGVTASRFAVQPLGAGLSLVLFVVLLLARKRMFSGGVLLLFLAISGLAQLGLGFMRADDASYLAGWRSDQWLNAAQALAGGVLAAYRGLLSTNREI